MTVLYCIWLDTAAYRTGVKVSVTTNSDLSYSSIEDGEVCKSLKKAAFCKLGPSLGGKKKPTFDRLWAAIAAGFGYTASNSTKQIFHDGEASSKTYLLTAARHHYGLMKREVMEITDYAVPYCSNTISQEVFSSSHTQMSRPYPNASDCKNKGERPRGKSRILTDTEKKKSKKASESEEEDDILLSSSNGETFEDIVAKDKKI
ncbi:hypothetical protein ILUMI_18441 [Ignelater luminosus]|uniref:Uncharacterized protein n=1 Tax=Ignelater luminosus TaxID=2038154 RepID=A0A8K0CM31_IGNLU|nr:hypothetical protein ILUMI_18441 [Ignelater luminosus]